MRLSVNAILILFLINTLFAPTLSMAGSNDDLLQCMADCIIEEGESSKGVCKQRCAKINVDMNQSQNLDCMGTYKSCKKVCKADKPCIQTCKDALMNCR